MFVANDLQFVALNTVYIKFHKHPFAQNVLWGGEKIINDSV